MKQVLITGENSYIGSSFSKLLENEPDKFNVVTISVRGEEWKELDFSIYDSIFHVAGLAHADTGRISEEAKSQYYKINTDLTIEVAQKYKADCENANIEQKRQFVFMSSIIVYDQEHSLKSIRVIDETTIPCPSSFYGDSKLQAEIGLQRLQNDLFLVAIVRPPMIYGPNCKGNYSKLSMLAKKMIIFPDYPNKRSMLFVNNLSEYIKNLILQTEYGIFFPQNNEYVRTSYLVKEIADVNDDKIYLSKVFNYLILVLSLFPGKVGQMTKKAFGSLVYEKGMGKEIKFKQTNFTDSVKITEKRMLD